MNYTTTQKFSYLHSDRIVRYFAQHITAKYTRIRKNSSKHKIENNWEHFAICCLNNTCIAVGGVISNLVVNAAHIRIAYECNFQHLLY